MTRLFKFCFAILISLFLLSCSPLLDWRYVALGDASFDTDVVVLMPDKPKQEVLSFDFPALIGGSKQAPTLLVRVTEGEKKGVFVVSRWVFTNTPEVVNFAQSYQKDWIKAQVDGEHLQRLNLVEGDTVKKPSSISIKKITGTIFDDIWVSSSSILFGKAPLGREQVSRMTLVTHQNQLIWVQMTYFGTLNVPREDMLSWLNSLSFAPR